MKLLDISKFTLKTQETIFEDKVEIIEDSSTPLFSDDNFYIDVNQGLKYIVLNKKELANFIDTLLVLDLVDENCSFHTWSIMRPVKTKDGKELQACKYIIDNDIVCSSVDIEFALMSRSDSTFNVDNLKVKSVFDNGFI